ncbi:MAG: hypothetical protein V3V40_06345 [Nitrosomonadaceae bacterium]
MVEHYILIDSATGKALSQTRNPKALERVRPGQEFITVDENDIKGTWNPDTRSFDVPVPISRRSKSEFWDRFTQEEKAQLLTLAKTDIRAELFVMDLHMMEGIINAKAPWILERLTALDIFGYEALARITE